MVDSVSWVAKVGGAAMQGRQRRQLPQRHRTPSHTRPMTASHNFFIWHLAQVSSPTRQVVDVSLDRLSFPT